MKIRQISEAEPKTFAIVFAKGDEVASGLLAFAKQEGITAASLTALGAFEKATLGYFDREQKEYVKIPVDEQVEVLSLIGNISRVAGKEEPQVHAHVVVGKRDGTTRGGHLLDAHVWPTLEVIVIEEPAYLQREYDPETGITLLPAS